MQWFYFLSIHRLPVGIALLIQYLAPLLVALWARYVLHEHVRRRIWVALALALVGLSLIVELWGGARARSTASASRPRSPPQSPTRSTSCWPSARSAGATRSRSRLYGFAFAALFWVVVQPLWEFPVRQHGRQRLPARQPRRQEAPLWLLVAFVVLLGTIATFALVVSALRHISATRVGIVAMLEPVAAAAVAWAWLGESLGRRSSSAAAIVLAGIASGADGAVKPTTTGTHPDRGGTLGFSAVH